MITTKRFTKDDITTVLELGFGSHDGYTDYYVSLDTVVIKQTKVQSAAHDSWRATLAMLVACGWIEDVKSVMSS